MPKIKKIVTAGNPKAYEQYKAVVDAYKIQNPVKFELKRAYFENKLAELKGDE